MHLNNNILGVVVASAAQAAAETIVIQASNTAFEPNSVNASAGDILEFHFAPNNHSVVMGDLDNPCQPAATGGFYSGFLPVTSGENSQVFQVTINDTTPIVFYCSQNASDHNHCKSGMMGFVNQADESVMTTYMTAAADSSVNISPNVGPFGGSLVANPSNSSSSSNSTGTTTANSTSTSTATSSSTESGKSTETDSSASSTNTGSPHNNHGGAALAGSGFLAIVAAVMAF